MNTCKTCALNDCCQWRKWISESGAVWKDGCNYHVPAKRTSKFNNRIVKADGYTFQSQGEYEYWLLLKERERNGEIVPGSIEVHRVIELFPRHIDMDGNDYPREIYRVDFAFRYIANDDHQVYVEFKGKDLPLGRLKRRVALGSGLDVRVVWAKGGRR